MAISLLLGYVTALRLSPTFVLFANRSIPGPASPASVHLIDFYVTISGVVEVKLSTPKHVNLAVVFDCIISINGDFPGLVDIEGEFLIWRGKGRGRLQ